MMEAIIRRSGRQWAIWGWSPAHLRELSTAPWVYPLILSVALAVRMSHIVALRSTLWFDHLDLDPRYFDEWGRRIAAGDWMGSQVFFVDPLYPYLLGTLYWLFGHDLLLIRLLQVAIGVSTVALVWYLGRRLGNRAIGNAAALMYAIYAPAVFNEAEIEKTAFATFFLLVAVTQSLRNTRKAWLLGGVAIGLATLCRANMIVLALPLGLYLARGPNGWSLRRAGRSSPAALSCLRRSSGATTTSAASSSSSVRLVRTCIWVTILYNTGGSYGRCLSCDRRPNTKRTTSAAVAEASTGHAMRSGEVSRYWARAAVDHVVAPILGLRRECWSKRPRLLFNHYEVPDNQDMYFVARYSPVLRWSLPGFGWVFPLGVLGMIVSWPRRDVRLIAATMALDPCSVILFFVLARFRQPLMPFWVVFAALGGRWLFAGRRREFRRVAMAIAGMAVCGLVAMQDLPFHDRGVNLALAWHNLGALQARVGRFDEAVASEEAAARLLPDHEDIVTSLGRFYLHLGRLDEAERALLTRDSRQPGGRVMRGSPWVTSIGERDESELARGSYNAKRAIRGPPPSQEPAPSLTSSAPTMPADRPAASHYLANLGRPSGIAALAVVLFHVDVVQPAVDEPRRLRGVPPRLPDGRSVLRPSGFV